MPELKSQKPTYTTDFVPGSTLNSVFLGNPLLDNMMHAILALGAELWAAKRRIKVIESLLAEKREVTLAAIEAYVTTPEQDKAWAAERDLMIKMTYGSLLNGGADPTPASAQK